MAQALWNGHISFGLVQIPVGLFSAESKKDLSFHLVDSRDHARIRYERVNEATGEEVPWSEVVKAYATEDDKLVLLTDDDFRRAAAEATRTINIEGFINLDAIHPIYYEKPYYISPGKHGAKGYALLRQALEETGLVGLARVVIRSRERMAVLFIRDNTLTLMLLRYKHELRDAAPFAAPAPETKPARIAPAEAEMAEQLVRSMKVAFEPAKYKDEYRDALLSWIDKKAKSGGKTPRVEPAEEPELPPTYSMADLLKQSIRRGGRSGKGAGPPKSRKAKTHPRRKAG